MTLKITPWMLEHIELVSKVALELGIPKDIPVEMAEFGFISIDDTLSFELLKAVSAALGDK